MPSLVDTHLHDVGLADTAFYESRLHPAVFRVRALLRPWIDYELPLITYIQSNFHTSFLTAFFLLTANLGSHTFYVLVLPLPIWLGHVELARDMILVLGAGIYLTGFVKDLLSLPRPLSPPTKRLTMSHYTSKEYGCPSSHSANATAVAIILAMHVNNLTNQSLQTPMYIGLFTYWLTLVSGRLYCGMHGLVDIVLGCTIGVFTVILRLATKYSHDSSILSANTHLTALIAVLPYAAAIYYHPVPLEGCPCFEDSVAFLAVLAGLDIAYATLAVTSPSTSLDIYTGHSASFLWQYADSGIFGLLLRIIIGVVAVVFWKSGSTPLLRKLFSSKTTKPLSFADIPRFDPIIIVKFLVYAGIPIVVVYTKFVFEWLNI